MTYEEGFYYTDSNWSIGIPGMELTGDSLSNFRPVLITESCETFGVASLDARYYENTGDGYDPYSDGLNFGIYGYLEGNIVASLEIELAKGADAFIDLGNSFNLIDELRMALLNPYWNGASTWNGIVIDEMAIVPAIPLPASGILLGGILAAGAGCVHWRRRRHVS